MKELLLALGQIIGVFFVITVVTLAVSFMVRGLNSITKNEMNYYKK